MFKRRSTGLTWAALVLLSSTFPAAVAQGVFIDGELFRDPTQPSHLSLGDPQDAPVGAPWTAPDRGRYALSFIRTGGQRSIAVINNQAVSPGDRIEDALVHDIRPTEVVLIVGGQELILSTVTHTVRESVD